MIASPLLTTAQVAELLGISQDGVSSLIASGTLPGIDVSREEVASRDGGSAAKT